MATSPFTPKPLPKSDPNTGAGGSLSSTEDSKPTAPPKPSGESSNTDGSTTNAFGVKQNPNQSTVPIGTGRTGGGSRGGGGGNGSSGSSSTTTESPATTIAPQLSASRQVQPLLSSSQAKSDPLKSIDYDSRFDRGSSLSSSMAMQGYRYNASGVGGNLLAPPVREVSSTNPRSVSERTVGEFRPDFMQLASRQREQQFVRTNPNQSIDFNKLPPTFGGNSLEPTFTLASPRREVISSGQQTTVLTRTFGTAQEAQQAQTNVTPSQRRALAQSSIEGQSLALQRQREMAELQQIANQNRGFIRTTALGTAEQFAVNFGQTRIPRQALVNTFFSGGLSPNIRSNIARTVGAQYRGARDLLSGNFSGFGSNLKESASGAFGLLGAPTQQASFISLSKEEKAFFKANPQIVTMGFNRRDSDLNFVQNFGLNFPLVEPITQEALSLTSRPIGGTLGKAQSSFIAGATQGLNTQADRKLATRIAVTQRQATIFGQGVIDVVTSGAVEAFGKSRYVVGGIERVYQATTQSKLARNVALDISKQIALKAGPVEAFVNVETQAGSRGQTAGYADIAIGVGSGAFSAGTASYAQNYPRLTGNKALTRLANVVTYGTDPSELVGDIGEQSVANIRIRSGEPLRIPQASLSTRRGLFTAELRNVPRQVENPFGFETGTKSSVRTVTLGFNPLSSRQPTVGTSVPVSARTQTSNFDSFVSPFSQVGTQTQSQVSPVTNPFASTSSRTQSQIDTIPQTPTQTQAQTQVNSAVNSFVSPNTSSFVNFFPALLPPDLGGGFNRGRPRKRTGKTRRAYSRDVSSVLFGNVLKAPKGKGYKKSLAVESGLGVRF